MRKTSVKATASVLAWMAVAVWADRGQDGPVAAETASPPPGLKVERITRQNPSPAEIHVFHVDPNAPDLALTLIKGGLTVHGRESLSDMARRVGQFPCEPLAAVNGGFWDAFGRPVGLCAGDGRIFTASTHRWTFLLTDQGPRMGMRIGAARTRKSISIGDRDWTLSGLNATAPTNGAHLYLPEFGLQTPVVPEETMGWRLEFPPDAPRRLNETFAALSTRKRRGPGPFPLEEGTAWLLDLSASDDEPTSFSMNLSAEIEWRIEPEDSPVHLALSAGPILLSNGEIVVDEAESESKKLDARNRRARTAVGFSDDGALIFLTVDDGRAGVSEGLTLGETARAMLEQGAVEAMNLDGGSSTTSWHRGALLARSNRWLGPRAISNGLFVMRCADE